MTLARMFRALARRERQGVQIHPQRGELGSPKDHLGATLDPLPTENRDSSMGHPLAQKHSSLLFGNQRKTPSAGGALLSSGSLRLFLPNFPSYPLCSIQLSGPNFPQVLCSTSPFTCKCWFVPPASPALPGKSDFHCTAQAWAPLPSPPPL